MKRAFSLPALVVLLVAAAAFILLSGQSLPPIVASHFAANGRANGFMSRSTYLGLMLVVTVFVPLLLAFGYRAMRLIPTRFFNLPNRDYWLAPERAAETFSFLREHGVYFSAMLAAFFCFVHYLVVQANALHPPRLSEPLFVGGLLLFLSAMAVWVGVLLVHFRRRP